MLILEVDISHVVKFLMEFELDYHLAFSARIPVTVYWTSRIIVQWSFNLSFKELSWKRWQEAFCFINVLIISVIVKPQCFLNLIFCYLNFELVIRAFFNGRYIKIFYSKIVLCVKFWKFEVSRLIKFLLLHWISSHYLNIILQLDIVFFVFVVHISRCSFNVIYWCLRNNLNGANKNWNGKSCHESHNLFF